MTSWIVRQLTRSDVSSIAELHCRAFPGSLLGQLGVDLVQRYYEANLSGPGVEGWVASDGDVVVGFLVGGCFAGETSAFVRHNRALLLRRVLRRPWMVARIGSGHLLRSVSSLLVRPARHRAEVPERVPQDSFGVLAIAVEPDRRRCGVGRALLACAEQRARQRGCVRLHLTLDPRDGETAAFYREAGWLHPGVAGDRAWAWLMIRELAP